MPVISVVVPVYEAENCLRELHRRLLAALQSITSDFEILLVEDGSRDGSWNVIQAIASEDPRVRGIGLTRNFGQHYAISAGLDYAEGDHVVVMDCDLQDRPEDIPRLYAKAKEGHPVVIGLRPSKKKTGKPLSSKIFYFLFSKWSGMKYDDRICNFRVLSKPVVETLRGVREQLRFFGGLVQWTGYPAAYVDVDHDARYAGHTTYNFTKLWKLASETIIAYSDRPLRMTVRFGFFMAAVSFLFGVWILFRALLGRTAVMGWSSLIVSLYFLGGIIIMILGMIGIYLGKTFDEAKKRPIYIVLHDTKKRT